MAQRRHDAVFIQVSGQPVSLIPFTCKCHDPDHAVRGVKIPSELFKVRDSTIFLRVCALEGAVHIWPLQVNAEYLSARNASRIRPLRACHPCDVPERSGQDLFRLRDRCRQNAGHSLSGTAKKPSAESRLVAVIGVKAIRAVCMHVYESGHYTHIAAIQVRPLCSIRIDPFNPAGRRGDLNLRPEPVVYDPDSSALQYHRGFSFPCIGALDLRRLH